MGSGNRVVGSVWDKELLTVTWETGVLRVRGREEEEYSNFSFPAHLSFPACRPLTL